jgi:hypothetical protein
MKSLNVAVARKIRVLKNTRHDQPDYALIRDDETSELLHVGQVRYIRQVARKRYNTVVSN